MELSQRSNRYAPEESHQTLDLENEFDDFVLHEQLEQPKLNPNEQTSVTHTRSNSLLNDHKKKRDKSISIKTIINLDKKLLSISKVFYKRKSNANHHSNVTIHTILFILAGVFIGFYLATLLRNTLLNCSDSSFSCCKNNNNNNFQSDNSLRNNPISIYKEIEPNKRLVFIGVMTAQKYLDTRAQSVFNTWGKTIPGKMSFFSRSGSSTVFDLPLVSLPGVDDSYPPQKKSFMMLKFMHDNYLNKFEWFMRVDDDVYIKPDKLEAFLRSLNSSTPHFIGQAGLGNKDEFGLLSLDYDENFCMGGPGIIMSRETLRLVVPHISYCLKNLYSTHEDVEIGRCVRKFANISCTWSYEMQHIFHHNSSGNDAFTGDLLERDVLKAISLHPVKQSPYQYRLHNFINERKIIDMRQRYLFLQRETYRLRKELMPSLESNRTTTKPNVVANAEFESEIDSDFDNFVLKKNENMSDECLKNRFHLKPSLFNIKAPKKREERYDFDFFTRSLFSPSYVSPKRGLEGFWKRSIVDSIRQIMEEINKNSIERGRIIDFKDILYGYVRHHPLTGLDYIIDLLLIYRKYEGRKMTVPVRRHAYIRNSYTDMLFREDDLVSSIFIKGPKNLKEEPNQTNQDNADKSNTLIKRIANFILPLDKNPRDTNKLEQNNSDFNLGIMKLNEMDKYFYVDKLLSSKSVNFVLPLTGRWDIFKRFMVNYENICLRTNENTRLVVVLFENDASAKITDETLLKGEQKQSDLIKELFNNLKKKYPTNVNDKTLNLILNSSAFSRSIGCEIGAASFDVHDLIFFIDVDIFFTNEFLLRARLNTIEYKQVYYPIVFSEYDPDDTQDAIRVINNKMASSKKKSFLNSEDIFKESFTYDFNSDSGYWRQFGFGIVSVYNSDLRRVGGFDTSIVGWGKEDVDLFEKFIKSNLTLFRSVDPGLIHVFHKIDCDPNLSHEQMIMCMGSKATSIASQRVLAKLVFEKNAHLIDAESKSPSTPSSDHKLK